MNLLQFTSLIIRAILCVGGILLAYMFFLKTKQIMGSGIDLSPFLGIGIFFLFAGISQMFFTYYFYFIFEFDLEPIFIYACASYTGIYGIIGLVFFSEKMLGKTKYAFTIFSIISCIYGIFFINTVSDLRFFSNIMMPITTASTISLRKTDTIIAAIRMNIRMLLN